MSEARSLPEPEQQDADQRQQRSLAEWITLSLSIAILLALAGLVTYEQVTSGEEPALIEVQPRLDDMRREQEAYYLPVTVTNQGDDTAEAVQVRLALILPDGQRSIGQFQVDFLAGGASEEATVVFPVDPAGGTLAVESISFLNP
jgi:uncharacterized protein (TIGR02588 family)